MNPTSAMTGVAAGDRIDGLVDIPMIGEELTDYELAMVSGARPMQYVGECLVNEKVMRDYRSVCNDED